MPPSPAQSDRNLLFGILALQMDFISRDALIKAMHAWVLEKSKSLGDILHEQGALNADEHALLEALVRKHLHKHDGDAEKSLAAVSSVASVRQELEQIADADLHASLAHVSAARNDEDDPYASRAASVGAATSAGLRFRVLRPHAKGGIGQVSVALDEELRREVALKEIQDKHADHPESRARFVLEAEVTGGLEHPGIVPVYGLGCYDDGRPFYAMRFIRGDSLKEAIAKFHEAEGPRRDPGERALALRGLLGRFVDVCNAVAYAHSRGVLHRDLKPGNVMLGQYGETLVVDWGLAKVTGRTEAPSQPAEAHLTPAADGGLAPTLMGSAVGTPAFMSPEQAAGRLDLLGPASDVYSLGATLYALLTGKAPFAGADAAALLRRAQRGEFPPPRQVSRAVSAALEAVCLKAMAVRPEGRYASARALADDVEHWLADEPVTAYREPLARRLGRWRRRHPAATAAVLVTLLLVCGGWLWLAWDRQARREETGRRLNLALGKAEQLRDEARTVALDGPGRAEAAVALWKQGLAAVDEAEGVLAAGLPDEEMRRQVGALRGKLESAAAAAEQALVQLRKNAKLLAEVEEAPLLAVLTRGGRLDDRAADEAFARAFAEYGMDVRASGPEAVERWLRQCPTRMVEPLLVALNDWEQYAVSRKRRELLREVLRRADPDPRRRRLRQALVQAIPAPLRQLAAQAKEERLPAAVLSHLGQALFRQKQTALAVDLLREARRRYPADFRTHFWLGASLRELRAGRPASLEEAVGCMHAAVALRPQSSFAYNGLGAALHDKKDLAGAIAAFRNAIALDPKLPQAHTNLGVALHERKDPAGAIAAHRDAIALDPGFALAHTNLGVALHGNKDLVGAIAAHRKALEFDPKCALAHSNLGAALRKNKDLAGAIAAFRDAIKLDPEFAEAHSNLGTALREKKDLPGAIAAFREAIVLAPNDAPTHSNLGNALRDKKDLVGAIAAYRKAIALDPKFAQAHGNLGVALHERRDLVGAIAAYRAALKLDPNDAPTYSNLGNALRETEDLAGAIAACRQAIELDPKFAQAHSSLGLALQEKKDLAGAITAYRDALALAPDDAPTHYQLGLALRDLRRFGEALAAFRRVQHLALAQPAWKGLADKGARQAEQLALTDRLHAVVKGEAQPASTAERLALAERCRQEERLYATSARFYGEAFGQDPKLAEDLQAGHRYAAARAAALAGVGQGKDGEKLDEGARARLRQQALDWLHADLALWRKQAEGAPEARAGAEKVLRQWRRESDLAGIRDDGALDGLPEAERATCERFWADVDALLKKVREAGKSLK